MVLATESLIFFTSKLAHRFNLFFFSFLEETHDSNKTKAEAKSLECQGLDPQKLKDLAAFRELPDDSRRKYIATWQGFCLKKDIRVGKTPTKDDLYSFLGKKF